MSRKRNGFTLFLVLLASVVMLGVVTVSQAEECPDQGGRGADKGIINPPDTDDRRHGCDDETTKTRENNGSGNETDCEDDNNGPIRKGCVVHAPVLAIVKSGVIVQDGGQSGVLDPGDRVTYTLNINNNGAGPATNVVIRDAINENLSGGGCAPGQDQPTTLLGGTGDVVTLTIASLATGGNATLSFTVVIPAGTFHDCNRGSVQSDQTTQQFSNTVAL